MHRDDGLRARCDQRFQPGFIQVQRIRPDVGEDRSGAAQDEGVDRRDKGERRDDDLVAGLDIQQEGGHLQRVGAGGGQQDLGDAQLLLEQGAGFPGERSIPGKLGVR